MNQTEKIPVIETETKQERGDEEENLESTETEEDKVMKIKVTSKEYEIIYELNQPQEPKLPWKPSCQSPTASLSERAARHGWLRSR